MLHIDSANKGKVLQILPLLALLSTVQLVLLALWLLIFALPGPPLLSVTVLAVFVFASIVRYFPVLHTFSTTMGAWWAVGIIVIQLGLLGMVVRFGTRFGILWPTIAHLQPRLVELISHFAVYVLCWHIVHWTITRRLPFSTRKLNVNLSDGVLASSLLVSVSVILCIIAFSDACSIQARRYFHLYKAKDLSELEQIALNPDAESTERVAALLTISGLGVVRTSPEVRESIINEAKNMSGDNELITRSANFALEFVKLQGDVETPSSFYSKEQTMHLMFETEWRFIKCGGTL